MSTMPKPTAFEPTAEEIDALLDLPEGHKLLELAAKLAEINLKLWELNQEGKSGTQEYKDLMVEGLATIARSLPDPQEG